jgi:hypothetical protein
MREFEEMFKSRIFCIKPLLSLSTQISNCSHFSQDFTPLISEHFSIKNKPLHLKEFWGYGILLHEQRYI